MCIFKSQHCEPICQIVKTFSEMCAEVCYCSSWFNLDFAVITFVELHCQICFFPPFFKEFCFPDKYLLSLIHCSCLGARNRNLLHRFTRFQEKKKKKKNLTRLSSAKRPLDAKTQLLTFQRTFSHFTSQCRETAKTLIHRSGDSFFFLQYHRANIQKPSTTKNSSPCFSMLMHSLT